MTHLGWLRWQHCLSHSSVDYPQYLPWQNMRFKRVDVKSYPLPSLCMHQLTCHWPLQVMWPNPELRCKEVHSSFMGRRIWVTQQGAEIQDGVKNWATLPHSLTSVPSSPGEDAGSTCPCPLDLTTSVCSHELLYPLAEGCPLISKRPLCPCKF